MIGSFYSNIKTQGCIDCQSLQKYRNVSRHTCRTSRYWWSPNKLISTDMTHSVVIFGQYVSINKDALYFCTSFILHFERCTCNKLIYKYEVNTPYGTGCAYVCGLQITKCCNYFIPKDYHNSNCKWWICNATTVCDVVDYKCLAEITWTAPSQTELWPV